MAMQIVDLLFAVVAGIAMVVGASAVGYALIRDALR